MRLLVLTPDLGTVVAPASDLATALATAAWDAMALAWSAAEAYPGMPAPDDLDVVDRAHPHVPAAAAGVVAVARVEFYRRCTEAEALAIDQAFEAQPLRLRRIFDAAQFFRSDAPEWPLLQAAAVGLFGEARAAELLAPTA